MSDHKALIDELRATHCSNEGLHDQAADALEACNAENAALRAFVEASTEQDLQLSRVLHEMAGAVSLCWIPRPTGEFDSSQAIEFVSNAIEELRGFVSDAKAALAAGEGEGK